ncbi:MAG: hypothetical protein LBN36_03980 [Clostridiales Family XIII bacterium]|jgi:hypothetical protein|nr:hypothetical protein [Clostridiales Family XIII bacterium]
MIAALFYIITYFALTCGVYLYAKSEQKQNAFLWIPVSLLLCECYSAVIAGLLSLVHIPVDLVSIGIAYLIAAALLFFRIRRQRKRQQFELRIADIAFGLILLLLIAVMGYMRFWTANPIIFATIDPAERFGNAMNIAVLKSVITHFPNLYFIQLSGSLFIQAMNPFFPGVLPFRFFEIKDLLNLWFTGALFYGAAGCYMKNRFSKIIAFILTFAFVAGFPWNNQLWGFVYPGVALNLIILVLIGATLLLQDRLDRMPAYLIIALGCFGVGVCYTLYVPPLYIAAFLAIALYLYRKRKAGRNNALNAEGFTGHNADHRQTARPLRTLSFWGHLAVTEISVFIIPTVWTAVNTLALDAGGESNVGNSITAEGAIYRNLFTDFIPYVPFAFYFLYRACRKKEFDFSSIFSIVFAIFQIGLLVMMLQGKISTYYYYKVYFVTWFIFLFLACLAVDQLSKHVSAKRLIAVYLICWMLVGGVGILGLDSKLSARYPLANPQPGADVSFRIYTNNLFYFPPPGVNNIININWDFINLCTEAQRLSAEAGETARIEMVTDSFQNSFWKDALTSQLLIFHEGMPQEKEGLWIVLPDNAYYEFDKEYLDSLPKLYENERGFVVKPV